MTTFSVALNDPLNVAGSDSANLVNSVQAAADEWGSLIQGIGDIQIRVDIAKLDPGTIATGASYDSTFKGFDAIGYPFFQPDTVSEIRNGIDPNGANPDIIITVDANEVHKLSYDVSGTQNIPAGKYDAVTVFAHEIGHGLGIGSLSPGGFVNSATAFNGEPLPLTADLGHIDIPGDLMYPVATPGVRTEISDADIAYVQDVGLPIATDRADILILGSANDSFSALGGNDRISGGDGADVIYGNQGSDGIYGNAGSDTLFGGQGDDSIFGGRDNDIVYGNLGNDVIYGNLGDDQVFGGQGNDMLFGGAGHDTLYGGSGNDLLDGGAGSDLFVFSSNSGADTISGFNVAGGERIDLQGQTYTLDPGKDGSALLTLSGGGTVDIEGIAAGQVNPTYFTSSHS